MATPDGTVTFEAQGKSRTLRFTTNALCLLEDKTEKTTLDIATELQFNPRMTTIRAMFWAGCGDHGLTLAQIGEMIDDMGKAEAIEVAREAFTAAFPDKDGSEKAEGDPPPKAVAG
jgi:hypothetical protein